ncbi:uncharacterized protein LOC121373340 [Gigantopelta aegis]|uniref:uncharacterized protein LOC121373340 n=1 Tax=Gigantopelta aegis TaxID=1735272 RepID=UPI001B88C32A|nr:uncharacterized protein LOC121373340 [Gigantopelta aegis]XP_041355855.1 uncharacterized protein LOC121373340 [Gigantopelta aegis]
MLRRYYQSWLTTCHFVKLRFRRQPFLFYAFAVSLTIVVVIFWMYLKMTPRPPPGLILDKEIHDMFLGLKKPTYRPLRPIPLIIPQIHVKNLPPIIVSAHQTTVKAEENFFKFLQNKDIKCNNDMRLGHPHDGGWNVCMSPPLGFGDNCLVYSFGIGNDWQFEDAVSKIYGCRVLAYDPSMDVADHNRSNLITFKRLGIGPKNEVTPAGWKVKTFGTFLKDEGHENTIINYLKFDIEYSEWRVLESLFKERSLKNVKQIGFEAHSKELFQVSKLDMPTGKEEFLKMYTTLRRLENLNFRKFNYRLNPFGEYRSKHSNKIQSCCYELHYVNMNMVRSNETIIHDKDSELFH